MVLLGRRVVEGTGVDIAAAKVVDNIVDVVKRMIGK
jgi:hypothetical protein